MLETDLFAGGDDLPVGKLEKQKIFSRCEGVPVDLDVERSVSENGLESDASDIHKIDARKSGSGNLQEVVGIGIVVRLLYGEVLGLRFRSLFDDRSLFFVLRLFGTNGFYGDLRRYSILIVAIIFCFTGKLQKGRIPEMKIQEGILTDNLTIEFDTFYVEKLLDG